MPQPWQQARQQFTAPWQQAGAVAGPSPAPAPTPMAPAIQQGGRAPVGPITRQPAGYRAPPSQTNPWQQPWVVPNSERDINASRSQSMSDASRASDPRFLQQQMEFRPGSSFNEQIAPGTMAASMDRMIGGAAGAQQNEIGMRAQNRQAQLGAENLASGAQNAQMKMLANSGVFGMQRNGLLMQQLMQQLGGGGTMQGIG